MGQIAEAFTSPRLGKGSKDQRLAAIERELKRVVKLLQRKSPAELVQVASAKLATTGAGAAVMRAEEVAAVIGTSKKTVSNDKDLQPRFGRGRYHPDDVRAYMARRAS